MSDSPVNQHCKGKRPLIQLSCYLHQQLKAILPHQGQDHQAGQVARNHQELLRLHPQKSHQPLTLFSNILILEDFLMPHSLKCLEDNRMLLKKALSREGQRATILVPTFEQRGTFLIQLPTLLRRKKTRKKTGKRSKRRRKGKELT